MDATYNSTISYGGETPTWGSSGSSYNYTFSGWDPELTDGMVVTGDAKFVALYDTELKTYEVTVEEGSNGATVSLELDDGTLVSLADDGYTLVIENCSRHTATVPDGGAEYSYIFSGWLADGYPINDFMPICSDVVLSYEISRVVNEYEVKIEVNDERFGSVTVDSITAPYGTSITCSGRELKMGDAASRAEVCNTDVCAGTFEGWDIPSATVTESTLAVVANFSLRNFVFDDVRYAPKGDSRIVVGCIEGTADVVIPEVVSFDGKEYIPESISEDAYWTFKAASTVSIGSTVKDIGHSALDGSSLRSFAVSEDNVNYSSIDGVLYNKDATILIKFPASKPSVDIPPTVVEIGDDAFEYAGVEPKNAGNEYLSSVVIPGNVVKIGKDAFLGSTLETIVLSDGITTIGEYAFGWCFNIKHIEFNTTLETAPSTAFLRVTFHDENGCEMGFSIDNMYGHWFEGSDSYNLNLYVPRSGTIVYNDVEYMITDSLESKTVRVHDLAYGSTKIVIPASLEYLGFDWSVSEIASKTFYDNNYLTKVTSHVDVGFKSFAGCKSLEEVVLVGNVSIGSYAFASCTSLTTVDLGDSTGIGTSAFSGCKCLSSIDLSKVVIVGKHAFYKCALTSADLSSAEVVAYGAFTGNKLKEVSFSDSLRRVSADAFYGYTFKDANGDVIDVKASSLWGLDFVGAKKVLTKVS